MSNSIKSALAAHSSPGSCRNKARLLVFPLLILFPAITASARGNHSATRRWTQTPDSASGTLAGRERDVLALEPGKAITRQLAGGASHSYQLALGAGQYARVVVDQRRINVAVSVFDPAGKNIAEVDMFPIGDWETVSFVAEAATSYRLEVQSPDKAAPAGSYEIQVKEVRPATDQDKSATAAERLVAEGILLVRQATADSCRNAIEKYQQSIPLWQSAKDAAWEATALYLMGYLYVYLGEQEKAFDVTNRALPLAQAAASDSDAEKRLLGMKVEANTLDVIAGIHTEFGDKKKALELLEQSLSLRRAIGDHAREIDTLYSMGKALTFMGEYRRALEVSSRARQIAVELGDRGKEGGLLNNICVIPTDMGEENKAMDLCNESLSIRRSMNDPFGEAITLNNIGNAYSDLGEYQKALDYYSQAQEIDKRLGNRQGQGIQLNNIAGVYGELSEHQKALDFYNQALEIFRADGNQYREANVLSNIAVEYAGMDDFQKALDTHLRVLSVRRALHDKAGEANTIGNIANCYQHLGDKQKAAEYYDKALSLYREGGNQRLLAVTLNNTGAFYRESGEPAKAMDYFNEGLELTRRIGDRGREALILAHIARIDRDRGNLIAAKGRIEQVLDDVESLRINVKSHQLRASFFAYVRKYYEFDIDLLMRLNKQQPAAGFDAAALQTSEKGRARSLLELIAEAGGEIRHGIDPVLGERERELRLMISDKADRQIRLLSSNHTQDQAAAAAKEIDALATEYDQLQAQIRQASPSYAALTQPVPLTLKQIQTEVLDEDTLLLEYALGEGGSFLWAVTPTSIKSFELPKRAEIESAARRVYELLTARNQKVASETSEQRRKRLQQVDAEYPKAAAEVSRMLLAPAASELKNKRLLIVGEGVLQYLPFAALPEPLPAGLAPGGPVPPKADGNRSQVSDDQPPLIVGHEIVTLPSASVLAVLRREAGSRKPADRTVAIFADPVFDIADPRISRQTKEQTAPPVERPSIDDVRRSGGESGLLDFVRLRFSRQEADQIARFGQGDKKLKALDFAASRELATSD